MSKKNKKHAKKTDDPTKKKKRKQSGSKLASKKKAKKESFFVNTSNTSASSQLAPHADEERYLVLSRNAYLEDKPFELPPHQYGVNFMESTENNIEREKGWAEQRAKYGFDERETWNLDVVFVEWLYSRLRMFKEIAPFPIQVACYEYKGEKLTQIESVDVVLEACESFIQHHDEIATDDCKRAYEDMSEAIKLWSEIFGSMWW